MNVTGYGAASIKISNPIWSNNPVRDASVIERYKRMFAVKDSLLSEAKPESQIYKLYRKQPSWVPVVVSRIQDSIIPTEHHIANDGRWLEQRVADKAVDFFWSAGDLLPGEPYLYSSSRGDLVTEFNANYGALTCIVSIDFIIMFAIVDGNPIEHRITPSSCLRTEVEELTEMLRMGHNGEMDTSR
jgi:hypothetical protein